MPTARLSLAFERLRDAAAGLILTALLVAGPAMAAPRLALLIGNASYANERPLRNPANDVDLLARVLRQDLRFDRVTVLKDLNRRDLADAVDRFIGEARGADVAFVYYSGHGMQAGGANFLIPVDARIQEPAHIRREGVSANELADSLGDSGARLAVLVLDACRDSPYALRTKSASRGLARLPVQSGNLLVAFATQEGATADDGEGANSPYVQALAAHIRRPELRVLEVFDEVGNQVRQATRQAQRPTRYGDLPVNVYFNGAPPPAPVAPAPVVITQPARDPVAARPTPAPANPSGKKPWYEQ